MPLQQAKNRSAVSQTTGREQKVSTTTVPSKLCRRCAVLRCRAMRRSARPQPDRIIHLDYQAKVRESSRTHRIRKKAKKLSPGFPCCTVQRQYRRRRRLAAAPLPSANPAIPGKRSHQGIGSILLRPSSLHHTSASGHRTFWNALLNCPAQNCQRPRCIISGNSSEISLLTIVAEQWRYHANAWW